jgi:hypothetical protein
MLCGVWIEAEPENPLGEVWAYLTPQEARDLLCALNYWAEEAPTDPDWHHHISDSGRELTVAIGQDAAEGRFADRQSESS